LETGFLTQKIGIAGYDASATDWANDIISRYKIQISQSSLSDVSLAEVDFEDSQASDVQTSGIMKPGNGFTVWDAEVQGVGLNTMGLKKGDLKLYYNTGSTMASGDLLDVIYKSLLPVPNKEG